MAGRNLVKNGYDVVYNKMEQQLFELLSLKLIKTISIVVSKEYKNSYFQVNSLKVLSLKIFTAHSEQATNIFSQDLLLILHASLQSKCLEYQVYPPVTKTKED